MGRAASKMVQDKERGEKGEDNILLSAAGTQNQKSAKREISKWGKSISLGQHLVHKYQYKAACSLADHDYSNRHICLMIIINAESASHNTEKESTLRIDLLDNEKTHSLNANK